MIIPHDTPHSSQNLPFRNKAEAWRALDAFLREYMFEGSEITLGNLNVHIRCQRMWTLFTLVQRYIQLSPGFFQFSKEDPLENSRVIRVIHQSP